MADGADLQAFVNAATAPTLPLADIQGLVLRGYKYYTIRHFIFKICDVDGARALCAKLQPQCGAELSVTTAEQWTAHPPYCLNISVTNSGLKLLIGESNYKKVYDRSFTIFSSFDTGADAAATAEMVGDVGPSDPRLWWPEPSRKLPTQPTSDDLHLLISVYARCEEDRETWSKRLLEMIPAGADGRPAIVPTFVQDADPLPLPEHAFNSDIQIHFGYADGFSQPRIAGTPWDDPGRADDDSPMVDSCNFAISADAPLYNAHPLLVNGSFGAFRLLYQDVAAFNAFTGNSAEGNLLAAKMCGRWKDGTPLEVSPAGPVPSLGDLDLINFNYVTPTPNQKGPRVADDLGQYCPYGAHTRRANPRDDTDVLGNTAPDGGPAYAGQHRIRRFATPYGPAWTPQTSGADRGLVGLFMGANISDQFEFLMQTWIGQGSFREPDASPNKSGVDPIFGPNGGDSEDFDYYSSASGSYEVSDAMSRFIVTRGGLYVFIPSVTALGYLARGALPPS